MKFKKTIAAAAALFATTTMASAADLAVKARPYAPVEVYNWTGFYIGAHVGAGWGETEASITGINGGGGGGFFPLSQTSSSGFLGGGQIGANWQSGWAVIGIQGDIAGANIEGRSPCAFLFSCETQTHWLASVTGRLGAVVLDRGLVYVKGGGAWLNTTASLRDPVGITGFNTIASEEVTHFGWTIGLGTEWMITRNWTAFIEYNYYNFDRDNFRFNVIPAPGTFADVDLKHTLSVAKVGVNYKFDWGTPVVAKY